MLDFSGRHRSVVAMLIVAFVAGSLVLLARRLRRPDVVVVPGPVAEAAAQGTEAVTEREREETAEGRAEVTVHVCGAVAKPGVYSLPEGARVADAVEAAGGLDKQACPEAVNMASVLADSAQVYVPAIESRGEDEAGTSARIQRGEGCPPAEPALSSRLHGAGKVNVNSASPSELEALPGIGPALAQRIVEFRQANARFERPEELMEVSGIGAKRYAALEELITVY